MTAATLTPWGGRVVFVPSTGSTMDDAKRLEEDGAPDGSLVWAGFQTAGRGRHTGRVWKGDVGRSLMFTVFWKPERFRVPTFAPSLVVGLGVCRWVESLAPNAPVRLKWPNDVYLNDRKLAGILVRRRWASSGTGAIHAGLGINLAPPEAEGFRTAAASLEDVGVTVSPAEALDSLLPALATALLEPQPHAACQSRLWRLGQDMELTAGPQGSRGSGLVHGIDHDGSLLWQGSSGLEVVSSGE